MKVWILHHHLLTGGVTSVIHTQCKAYQQAGLDYEVVVGDPARRSPGGKEPTVIEGLNYLPKDLNKDTLDLKYQELKAALEPLAQEGLLHVHNLNLGKNPLLNLVIADLLRSGAKVINHCHDFAEDHRPLNMEHLNNIVVEYAGRDLEEVLYPKGQNLIYAIINKADRHLLNKHGVEDDKIFNTPNAISPPKPALAGARARVLSQLGLPDLPLVLYPVRAITRKNIPELLLLSILFKGQASFAITQPAKNPIEVEAVQPWVDLAQELKLPVVFEAGLKTDFKALMAGCQVVVTTSTNEGFGLGFLEPWLHRKAVVGRNLPQVTSDFHEQGLKFPHLYDQLKIKGVDFPKMDDPEKRATLLSANQNLSIAKSILAENQLDNLLSPSDPELIEANAQKILEHYSVETYGQNFKQIYATSF